MRAAVMGASGFIGRHLCRALVERGDSVSALVRSPEAAHSLATMGVGPVIGDVMDREAVRRVCSAADVVFNVAGVLGRRDVALEEMERVNAQAAGEVVRSAAEARAGRVVHISTAGVSGPLPSDVAAAEDYPCAPKTYYQRTKLAGESEALKAHDDTGIPLVIVRPSFVYGPADLHKLSLFRAISSRRMILVSGGVSRLHPVFVGDLVSGMLSAARNAAGSGETYILAGESPVTIADLVASIAAELGVRPPRLSLPAGLLFACARISEAAAARFHFEPLLTCSRVELLSENYVYSIQKARTDLGYNPLVDLREGVSRTVRWYVAHGFLPRRQERTHAR